MGIVGRDLLKGYLKDRLLKNAAMTTPRISVEGVFPKLHLTHKNAVIRSMETNERDMMREYMLKTFYAHAPVPSALKLTQTWPKFQYLNDELDLMLHSEVNQFIFDKSNTLVAAILNTAWPIDQSYDFFEADPVMWLNLAAEIANEETRDPLYASVIWRDYQFQLIYHIAQGLGQKRGVKHLMYGGMAFADPRLRDLDFLPFVIKATNDLAVASKSVYMAMGTIPRFMEYAEKSAPGIFVCLHRIPYKDLTFKRSPEEERAFSKLRDGMTAIASSTTNA